MDHQLNSRNYKELNAITGWKLEWDWEDENDNPDTDFGVVVYDIIPPQNYGFVIKDEYTANDVLLGMQRCGAFDFYMSVSERVLEEKDSKGRSVREVTMTKNQTHMKGPKDHTIRYLATEPDYLVYELMDFAGKKDIKFVALDDGEADTTDLIIKIPAQLDTKALEPYLYVRPLRSTSKLKNIS